MIDEVRHYLVDDTTTACGQRYRLTMLSTQNWDFVECKRCWYYAADKILQCSAK